MVSLPGLEKSWSIRSNGFKPSQGMLHSLYLSDILSKHVEMYYGLFVLYYHVTQTETKVGGLLCQTTKLGTDTLLQAKSLPLRTDCFLSVLCGWSGCPEEQQLMEQGCFSGYT